MLKMSFNSKDTKLVKAFCYENFIKKVFFIWIFINVIEELKSLKYWNKQRHKPWTFFEKLFKKGYKKILNSEILLNLSFFSYNLIDVKDKIQYRYKSYRSAIELNKCFSLWKV